MTDEPITPDSRICATCLWYRDAECHRHSPRDILGAYHDLLMYLAEQNNWTPEETTRAIVTPVWPEPAWNNTCGDWEAAERDDRTAQGNGP